MTVNELSPPITINPPPVVKQNDTITIIEKRIDTVTLVKHKTDTITVLEKKTDTLTVIKNKIDTVTIFEKKIDTVTLVKNKIDTVVQVVYINNNSTDTYVDTLSVKSYRPNNLIFILDVSYSMTENNSDKIKHAKLCVQTLIKKLRSVDKFTMMIFADTPKILFPTNYLTDRPLIVSQIENLSAKGGTNGASAIEMAYDIMQKNYMDKSNNEIYIFTDDQINDLSKKHKKMIKAKAEDKVQPIKFNLFAFGNENKYMGDMQELTNAGGGKLISINSEADARDKLIQLIKLNSSY